MYTHIYSIHTSKSDILLYMNLVDDINHPGTRRYSAFFRISMWWRIVYGLIRIVLSLILLKLIGSSYTDILASLMHHEVTEDANDFIFQTVYALLEDHSFTVTYFVAGYLFFWGCIDVFLSIFLLRHKLWAFPVSITLISLFILYSVFRLAHTHSLVLLSVICIDIAILYLINYEYKKLK